MKSSFAFLALSALMLGAFPALADEGRQLYQDKCAFCHEDRRAESHAPALAGKPARYHVEQAQAIASGQRLKDYSPLMGAYMDGTVSITVKGRNSSPPSAEELEKIAQYLATKP